jgi:hypothetical protein
MVAFIELTKSSQIVGFNKNYIGTTQFWFHLVILTNLLIRYKLTQILHTSEICHKIGKFPSLPLLRLCINRLFNP